MAAYVAGAAVASVLTILRFAQGLQTYYRRYAATGFEPNDLGLTVALSIPLALYLALRGRGPLRWVWRGAVALAIAAILLSASRTALVVSYRRPSLTLCGPGASRISPRESRAWCCSACWCSARCILRRIPPGSGWRRCSPKTLQAPCTAGRRSGSRA